MYLNSYNSNIGLEGHYPPSEINETEEDKCYMLSHVESKKYNKLVNMTKKQKTHRHKAYTSSQHAEQS